MKDKVYRSLALAVLAAFSLNVAANADGCAPVKKVCHKRHYRAAKRIAATPQLIKETKVVTTKTIEKPVVIEAPAAPAPAPVAVEQPAVITQPAVCETQTPVVIDRYQRRHRSLIHLGLFPFALFGQ